MLSKQFPLFYILSVFISYNYLDQIFLRPIWKGNLATQNRERKLQIFNIYDLDIYFLYAGLSSNSSYLWSMTIENVKARDFVFAP